MREARAAASLTHPNIAIIYEVDESDGIVFIAMELIEGRMLRSLLAERSLPVKEALRIGLEISEGLAKAHHARVVHRDLKPENVMVTGEGHVKILDFGLAKLLEREDEVPVSEASRLETISGEMTQQGRILGTASYMSPEQARGLSVDNRSDLFSFGIVLYEMVTGTVPFHGPTPMDTLSAILKNPVDPASQLNNDVTAGIGPHSRQMPREGPSRTLPGCARAGRRSDETQARYGIASRLRAQSPDRSRRREARNDHRSRGSLRDRWPSLRVWPGWVGKSGRIRFRKHARSSSVRFSRTPPTRRAAFRCLMTASTSPSSAPRGSPSARSIRGNPTHRGIGA